MSLREEADERRRRALYFATVDLEIGPQGLPCDHLAARRPDVVAGAGAVVLATVEAARPVSVRIWIAPATATDGDPATYAVQQLLPRYPDAPIRIDAVQRFIWCR